MFYLLRTLICRNLCCQQECWIAIGRGAKVVLAGDHLQLPPTIVSESISESSINAAEALSLTKEHKDLRKKAAKAGMSASFEVPALDLDKIGRDKDYSSFLLSTTMFVRLLGCFPQDGAKLIKRTLTTQYRMHQDIMAFPSAKLYQDLLVADESCREWLLNDLPGVKKRRGESEEENDVDHALVFVDTSMANMTEETEGQDNNGGSGPPQSGGPDDSKLNRGEAATVVEYVKNLMKSGVPAEGIAIITPYSAQVSKGTTMQCALVFLHAIDSLLTLFACMIECAIASIVEGGLPGDRDWHRGWLSRTREGGYHSDPCAVQ